MRTAASIILAFCLLCFLPARADWQPYDWLVTIETEEMPNQFEYAGSILKPVVLARVSFAKADGSNNTTYETFWYCQGKPFGLERQNQFNIDQGVNVAMSVTHKTASPTSNDYKAAANAILRLYLDIRINHSMATTAIVPGQSFDPITNELASEHFTVFDPPLDSPYKSVPSLVLQDNSSSRSQTMCYTAGGLGSY